MKTPKWYRIKKLQEVVQPNDMILAKTADGRAMMFKASLLNDMLQRIAMGNQPDHLQFPAIHFIPWVDLHDLIESE